MIVALITSMLYFLITLYAMRFLLKAVREISKRLLKFIREELSLSDVNFIRRSIYRSRYVYDFAPSHIYLPYFMRDTVYNMLRETRLLI